MCRISKLSYIPKFTALLVGMVFSTLTTLAQFLPQNHYKTQTANQVGKKIASARADLRQMPSIVIHQKSNPKNYIAQFKAYPQPRIILDEKLYDICTGFGTDSLHALACVIGHEMAHFYENHVWTESFSEMMGLAKDQGTDLTPTEKGILEAKADAFGLFYGYLAGYDTYRMLPKTLEAIYKEYRLPDKQEGYPAKSDRMKYSVVKINEISPLIFVFRAGQLLFLRREFDEAAACFDYILNHYPGPEIYNNAGLSRLAQAMELIEPAQIYFAYPFELDAETRLKRSTLRTSSGHPDVLKKISLLLGDAQEAFEKALLMDKFYAPAYTNLACTFSLKDNQPAAIGKINEFEKLVGTEELSGNAHLIRAIAMVRDVQIPRAKKDFDLAAQKKAYQHSYNTEAYKQLSQDWKDKTIQWLTHWPTFQGWIKSFWIQERENPGNTANQLIGPLTVPELGFSDEVSAVTMVVQGSNFPLMIKGMSKDQDRNLYLRLELPDYRLDAMYWSGGPSLGNDRIKETPIPAGDFPGRDPEYTLSGTGQIKYEYYPNEKMILEKENGMIKGLWKYTISY